MSIIIGLARQRSGRYCANDVSDFWAAKGPKWYHRYGVCPTTVSRSISLNTACQEVRRRADTQVPVPAPHVCTPMPGVRPTLLGQMAKRFLTAGPSAAISGPAGCHMDGVFKIGPHRYTDRADKLFLDDVEMTSTTMVTTFAVTYSLQMWPPRPSPWS